MSITVGNYSFEGPYTDTSKLEDSSGVYAIHCLRDSKYYLIDVGESASVKNRVESHDRQVCWKRECKKTLTVSVLYTPNKQQTGRMEIEQELRKQYDPPCGKL
jgi:excinuclease UvrABC nuclease subunit